MWATPPFINLAASNISLVTCNSFLNESPPGLTTGAASSSLAALEEICFGKSGFSGFEIGLDAKFDVYGL